MTDLPAGTYRMEAEKPGFKAIIKPDIVLQVQDALEINLEMALGSVAETVTVKAGAPTVQLATSAISTVVTSATVRELPLNGRSWTDLATLQPDVNAIENQVSFAVNADRGIRALEPKRLSPVSVLDYSRPSAAQQEGSQDRNVSQNRRRYSGH